MTMRGAHYTCPNDTVMTNKWHSATAVTNLCPTITYLAPAAITNYISQTRRPGVRKPGSLSPKKGCFLFHNSDFCSRKLTLTDFSRLFSALVRRRHGRMPTFFHLWPYFHLSQFFPSQFGGKEKLILVTYSEPCTPGTSIFWLYIFRKEGEIDLFDIFLGAPPGILPSQPLSMYISILARWTYNLSVWVILHKYQPRSYCYLHIPTSHFSLLFKFRVCYFQIFLWLNLIIEDFSEELTLNSRVYIRTNISGENILNWFTNQFPYKGNFSLFQIFSSALTERLQMRRRRISDEWPNTQTLLANTVNRSQYLSPRKRMWVVDKYRANNNSHNLHYLCTTEWRGGRQNNHRWTLLPWIHIRRANNVTLTINAKENTLNTTVSILAIFYLCSGIYSQPQFVITFP